MTANFDSYAVFLPNDPEGSQDGSYHLSIVLATDENDAIVKAAHDWYGRANVIEGTYIVCKQDMLTAYEVEQEQSASVRSQVSIPKSLNPSEWEIVP